jgi:microcystin-dependent protein
MFGGAAAPGGWLLCDGKSYSRTGFSALFSIISTFYGSVDGSSFNVPNLKQKVGVGLDASTTWAKNLGQTTGSMGYLGEVSHTLLIAELAAHGHSVSATQGTHTHTDSGHAHYCAGVAHTHGMDHYHNWNAQGSHTHSDAGHTHTLSTAIGAGSNFAANQPGWLFGATNTGTGYANIQAAATPAGNTVFASQTNAGWANTGGASALAFNSNAASAAISTVSAGAIAVAQSNVGSGTPHNNLQPYVVLNYIIKT